MSNQANPHPPSNTDAQSGPELDPETSHVFVWRTPSAKVLAGLEKAAQTLEGIDLRLTNTNISE